MDNKTGSIKHNLPFTVLLMSTATTILSHQQHTNSPVIATNQTEINVYLNNRFSLTTLTYCEVLL